MQGTVTSRVQSTNKQTPFLSFKPPLIQVRVSYYQWTPIILGLEAACFLMPYLIWHIFASASGLPMVSMIKAAKEMAKVCARLLS